MKTFLEFITEMKYPKYHLPAEPGTTPIPDGHVRLYHQTNEKNLNSIRRNGIQLKKSKGIEGPKAIYADTKGFYGKPHDTPTVEFHVPHKDWDKPFVKRDTVHSHEIIGIHRPWHRHARYLENDPKQIKNTLEGEHDHLLKDKEYGHAIKYIKQKYGHND